MTCEIVPLTEELASRFEYDGRREWTIHGENIQKVLSAFMALGDAYAAVNDGQIVAVAGMFQMSPGVGHTWMYFNQETAKRYCKTIILAIRKTVQIIADKRGFHRIQTFVEAGDQAGARFTESYGLTKESTMRAYGAKRQDMDVYAKVLDGR